MIPNEVELIKLARKQQHATPFFLTSKALLKHNYQAFANLFQGGEVYYAMKSNADPRILIYLNKLGSGFEAASIYEIEALLDVGVDPSRIIFGTSVKPKQHISLAKKAGVDRFAADSSEEIEKIAESAPGSRVFIRASVNDSDSVFAFSERFGAPLETVRDLLLLAKKKGLIPYGVSFHVGSQAVHEEHWADAILSIKPIMQRLLKDDIKLEVLDIGGGFPVIYNNHKHVPTLEEIVEHINKVLPTLPYQPRIIMEPGRGIATTTTVLVSEVISRTVRRGKVWLVLDGGIYNCLYEAMIHQGTTQYLVHTQRDSTKTSTFIPYVLAGPTGDSLDIITRDITLPPNIKVGDRLYFENAGAYTGTMASPFNGFPKPDLYLV